ncbi:MAG: hypothetical protein ACRETP_00660, partial [Steroidobacteraceae bacterium]
MEPHPFRLEAGYDPAGDQPQAIDKLVEGLTEGLAHQTLLGVTGSGKSVGYHDPILIAECAAGSARTRLVEAGPFIDGLMNSRGLSQCGSADTEQFAFADNSYLTPAYNPTSGETAWFPIAALLRHRAPKEMYRLVTRCGRTVEVTGDHNFWVLRQGRTTLIRTRDIKASDFLPVPDVVTPISSGIEELDILPYLADSDLFVYAEEQIIEYMGVAGRPVVVSAIANFVLNPCRKLYAVRHRLKGSGLSVRQFLGLLSATGGLGGRCPGPGITVGRAQRAYRLPALLPLSDQVLALFGYYIAEGNCQPQYISLANRHPVIR